MQLLHLMRPCNSFSDPGLPTGMAAMVLRGAIVLAAADPAALARFYAALLPWPGGGWLELYAPARSRPQPRQQGRLAVCLQRQSDRPDALAVLSAWIRAALVLGACWLETPRLEPFGAQAWLLDPEGNRLLLLVLL